MNETFPTLTRFQSALNSIETVCVAGRVVGVVGLVIEVIGLNSPIGSVCAIDVGTDTPLLAEVTGFRNDRLLLMAIGPMDGLKPDSPVTRVADSFMVPTGNSLLGRVVDGLGQPIDGKGPLGKVRWKSTNQNPPLPMARPAIVEPLVTGVRVIDGMLTCGKGQRMGIFAGSGVGKSTLLGSIARNSKSDVSVIALIGERGREVGEFIDRDLGTEGLTRSVVVVSTSDQPAIVRLKAALGAMTIAEYFRDSGKDVTFLMDSVTRFAMAQREIGLSIGEPPASKGYTPSVFATLPRLLERAGRSEKGSITGYFTVLVEGDDFNEPISDAVRGILDGHIILSRALAARNHYPSIDVLNSVSRVMPAVTEPEHVQRASWIRKHMATYEKARDLVNIGAYVNGSDPEIDAALQVMPDITKFLQQGKSEVSDFETTLECMSQIGNVNGTLY